MSEFNYHYLIYYYAHSPYHIYLFLIKQAKNIAILLFASFHAKGQIIYIKYLMGLIEMHSYQYFIKYRILFNC